MLVGINMCRENSTKQDEGDDAQGPHIYRARVCAALKDLRGDVSNGSQERLCRLLPSLTVLGQSKVNDLDDC